MGILLNSYQLTLGNTFCKYLYIRLQRYKIKIIQRNKLAIFAKIQRNKLAVLAKIQRNNSF